MVYPDKIKEGATIGLVSTSSPITAEREEQCVKAIEEMGFKVKKAPNITASKGGYMAGEESLRGEVLNSMFADKDVDAIFCIRGGDGANRIIDYLDLDVIRDNRKPFVGYSDVSSLHLLFNQKCDMVTFHGPMVSSNIVDNFTPEVREAFFAAINADAEYIYKAPAGHELKVAREGKAEGVMTGGNLTVICASLGTPYDMDTDGKILFIEEVGEHVGNLDRHVYQLRNAGKFDNIKGIVLGQFTDCREDVPGYDMTRIILDAIGDKDIPVIYNIQSGHDNPMINIPLGAMTCIDTSKKELRFMTGR
ncbi:MAG TPA: LD-carboxypeptidase [Candidatus Avanaerovorax faecigallinarum]|nr:LD-carboxypeptidase [Candidatus Avanaerovorax faecigallinarum]